MKTRLLKIIRKDKRFLIEHKHYVPGYPYSGWWYLTDTNIHKAVRHKRLKNILNEYKKLYVLKNKIKWVSRILFILLSALVYGILTSCSDKPIEVWNEKTITVPFDSMAYFQNILDSIQQ